MVGDVGIQVESQRRDVSRRGQDIAAYIVALGGDAEFLELGLVFADCEDNFTFGSLASGIKEAGRYLHIGGFFAV